MQKVITNKFVILLFFLLLITSLFIAITTTMQLTEKKYRIIKDPFELLTVTKQNTINNLIIDLREREDFESSHISQSINIPYVDGSELNQYLISKNSKNKNLYLLCYSGNRAAKTFNYLSELEYRKLFYIAFGYEEYVNCLGDEFVPAVGPCECLN